MSYVCSAPIGAGDFAACDFFYQAFTPNGMPNHIHILFGMRPTQSLSDLLRDIKRDSSLWINENKFVAGKFSWQEGYGAFSYSKSGIKP